MGALPDFFGERQSFYRLVGARKDSWRDGDTKPIGSFQIDGE
jgi:hypothetical protein